MKPPDVTKIFMMARFSAALIEEDLCPMCLGELDEGYECTKCGLDCEPSEPLTGE